MKQGNKNERKTKGIGMEAMYSSSLYAGVKPRVDGHAAG